MDERDFYASQEADALGLWIVEVMADMLECAGSVEAIERAVYLRSGCRGWCEFNADGIRFLRAFDSMWVFQVHVDDLDPQDDGPTLRLRIKLAINRLTEQGDLMGLEER